MAKPSYVECMLRFSRHLGKSLTGSELGFIISMLESHLVDPKVNCNNLNEQRCRNNYYYCTGIFSS